MQCGESLGCVLLTWLADHGSAHGLVDWLEPFIRGDEQGIAKRFDQAKGALGIIGILITSSFAIWKWWRFREAVLHNRLAEYIAESDRRLIPVRDDVVRLINRPDQRTSLRQPAFALELAHVLKRRGWERPINRAFASNIPDRQFEKIKQQLERRIQIARDAVHSLENQRSAANIIAASLASARASRARDPVVAHRFNEEASRLFHDAGSSGSDLVAIEGQAFQLLRLGNYEQSAKCYARLFEQANMLHDERARALLQSRAQRFRALITCSLQAAKNAWGFLTPGANSALSLRNPYEATFRRWELVEHAETHYAVAFVANQLDYVIKEPESLAAAAQAYERVLASLPRYWPAVLAADRRLQRAARAGLLRIKRAQDGNGYDREILCQARIGSEPLGDRGDATQSPPH